MCVFWIINGVWPNCDLEPQFGQFMKVILSLLLTNIVDVLRMYSTNCLRQVSTSGSRRGAKDRHKGPPMEQHRATHEPKQNQRTVKGNQKGAKGNQKGANGSKRDTEVSEKGAKGSQKEAKGTQKRPEGNPEWSQDDQMGASRFQTGSPKGSRN